MNPSRRFILGTVAALLAVPLLPKQGEQYRWAEQFQGIPASRGDAVVVNREGIPLVRLSAGEWECSDSGRSRGRAEGVVERTGVAHGAYVFDGEFWHPVSVTWDVDSFANGMNVIMRFSFPPGSPL